VEKLFKKHFSHILSAFIILTTNLNNLEQITNQGIYYLH